jgi:hypothetical protein
MLTGMVLSKFDNDVRKALHRLPTEKHHETQQANPPATRIDFYGIYSDFLINPDRCSNKSHIIPLESEGECEGKGGGGG